MKTTRQNCMEEFNGKKYPWREVEVPTPGLVWIATASLNRDLFDRNGQYVSTEARHVDELICYFVQDEQITLPDAELSALVEEEAYT